MEIILTKSVNKLGRAGSIVNVKKGYATNFLFPQEMAILATKANKEKLDSMKSDLEKQNAQNIVEAQKIADKLNDSKFEFIMQSSSDGRLFGSVNTKSLANVIAEKLQSNLVTYSNINLHEPIKFNGVYKIEINLHDEVSSNIFVVVAKSDEEAKKIFAEYTESLKEKTSKNKEDSTANAEDQSNI